MILKILLTIAILFSVVCLIEAGNQDNISAMVGWFVAMFFMSITFWNIIIEEAKKDKGGTK